MTSSPGRSPVDLRECIEELLKLTLSSYVDPKEQDSSKSKSTMVFSKEYCLKLLQDDPFNTLSSDSTCPSVGVPPYPLYKRLAESLLHSSTIVTTHQKAISVNEGISSDQNEDEWNELLSKEGSKLLDVIKAVDFELHVQEPYFTQLRDGQKTIEGRCAIGDYNKIDAGAIILFNKSLVLQVQEVRRHASFAEMLESESLMKVLPGIRTIEEGVQVYRNFYSEEKEKTNGVLAICVGKPYSQLLDIMSSILLGLGYEGVQRLLGLGHSVGTVPAALPPPISVLMSSFSSLHRLDVKCSKLTDGARALAKHAERSRDKYWGTLSGSDIHKNQLATAVVRRLITRCCWMNMHIVPPHGLVFEIRVPDGYGARWSGDGSKFIGFLEPYMMDGHSRGWKH
ncbi:hypothetical protein Leryth_022038 [Lithospermum erythrorhizon]|nr:hypothetical protein Leryth_022038 [Lithospermum erythrorhizon]